jgi:hypothetical protein
MMSDTTSNPSNTFTYTLPQCRGCGGKGWVDSMYKGAMVCPVCGGTGVATQSNLPYTTCKA